MQLSMTEEKLVQQKTRIQNLKTAVQNYKPGVCTERAIIWTTYFKNRDNRKKPQVIQMAEALKDVLLKKSINIYPDELIVGNFSSKRVGGSIYPELHGVPVVEDVFKFSGRKTTQNNTDDKTTSLKKRDGDIKKPFPSAIASSD